MNIAFEKMKVKVHWAGPHGKWYFQTQSPFQKEQKFKTEAV